MVRELLLVGCGSFIGGALRYGTSLIMQRVTTHGFPWATLLVNLLGCFLFGVIFALFSKQGSLSHSAYLLLATGFCGGFTTFSAFAHETTQMLQSGHTPLALAYMAISLLLGIAFVLLGYHVVK